MDRPGDAMGLARAAMPLAERAGDRRTIARVCSAIAESHQQRGEFGPDIDPIERALRLSSEEGDMPGLAHVLQLAAMHAAGVGAYGRTRQVLEQARAIAARTGDPLLQCQIHRAEGVVRVYTGDLEGALKVNLEGVALAHAHGLAEPELVMLHNAGDVLLRLGREREALYFFSESLRRCQATRFDRLADANQVFLGFLEATCLDLEAGLRRMQGAINAARARGGRWTVAQGHRLMGEALLARGDRRSALHHLEEALRLARKIGVRFLVDEASRCLARAQPER
jgi:tetratricopeptide (TPR) repeat protein